MARSPRTSEERSRGHDLQRYGQGSKENQETQICLRRDASDQEDNKIRGTAWVDDVALTPIPKSGAKK